MFYISLCICDVITSGFGGQHWGISPQIWGVVYLGGIFYAPRCVVPDTTQVKKKFVFHRRIYFYR